jgi:hypothetical protein
MFQDNSGVGLISENKNTSMPLPKKHLPLLSLRYHYYDGNHRNCCFQWLVRSRFMNSDKPCVLLSVYLLMRLFPTPIPRIPPVPILDFINRSSKSLEKSSLFLYRLLSSGVKCWSEPLIHASNMFCLISIL